MHWCLLVQCQASLSRLDDTITDFQNLIMASLRPIPTGNHCDKLQYTNMG